MSLSQIKVNNQIVTDVDSSIYRNSDNLITSGGVETEVRKLKSIDLINGLITFEPIEVNAYDDIFIDIPAGTVIKTISIYCYINYRETGSRDYFITSTPYIVPVDVTSLRTTFGGIFNISFEIYAKDNTVRTQSIMNNAVTLEKTSFSTSYNLINREKLHIGCYSNNEPGWVYSYNGNPSYDATEVITLKKDTIYTPVGGIRFIQYLDDNFVVTRLLLSGYNISLEEGEYAVIITFYASNEKEYMLVKGTNVPITYEDYKTVIDNEYIDMKTENERFSYLEENVNTMTFTNVIESLSSSRPLICDNLNIKQGEKYSFKFTGTAIADRYLILANTNDDWLYNRVLDYPSYDNTYFLTADFDIRSFYLWAVYGYSQSGIVNTELKCGINSELGKIQSDINKVSYQNDIAIPNVLYMLSEYTSDNKIISQNDIYYKEILKRWLPYDNYLWLSGPSFSRRWSNVASITNPSEGSTLNLYLRDYKTEEVLLSKQTTIHVGETGVGNDDIYVMVMGDSTVNGYCHKALYSYGFVPNCHCVGLRYSGNGQYDEGRGGWTLKAYSSISTSIYGHSPYWQPKENCCYLGSTGFWINAWLCVRGTQPSGFEPEYSCGRYNHYVNLFNENTGYFVNPQSGYIMYDSSEEKFKLYNGTSWVDTDQTDYEWGFSFKYLNVFNIQVPDYFVMSLGLNDFRGSIPNSTTLAQWNNKVNDLIEAYHDINANGYFIISTCTVSTGNMDNDSNDGDLNYQHAAMWQSKKNIIDNFSNRENEGVYIVDTALMVDADYGFSVTEKQIGHPLNTSITASKYILSGNPHFYPTYNSWGIPLAAFIQYTRNDKT